MKRVMFLLLVGLVLSACGGGDDGGGDDGGGDDGGGDDENPFEGRIYLVDSSDNTSGQGLEGGLSEGVAFAL